MPSHLSPQAVPSHPAEAAFPHPLCPPCSLLLSSPASSCHAWMLASVLLPGRHLLFPMHPSPTTGSALHNSPASCIPCSLPEPPEPKGVWPGPPTSASTALDIAWMFSSAMTTPSLNPGTLPSPPPPLLRFHFCEASWKPTAHAAPMPSLATPQQPHMCTPTQKHMHMHALACTRTCTHAHTTTRAHLFFLPYSASL